MSVLLRPHTKFPRNIEFGIDDDDLTIVPTPAYNFTAMETTSGTAPCLGVVDASSSSRWATRCRKVSPSSTTANLGLKCWDNKEDHRLEKRSGCEQFLYHYSLVATARMFELEYRTKLSEAFLKAHIMPCRNLAGAEESAEVHMPEWRGRPACVDGGVLAIADAAELYIETAKLLSPALTLDIILLYQLVTDGIVPVSFHLLGLAERVEPHNSRGVRYLASRDTIAATNGTLTYLMVRTDWGPHTSRGVRLQSGTRSQPVTNGTPTYLMDLYNPYGGIAVTVIEAHSLWAIVASDGNREDIPPLKLGLAGAGHVADFYGQVTGWLDKEEPSVVVGSSSSSRIPVHREEFEEVLKNSDPTHQCHRMLKAGRLCRNQTVRGMHC
ncbi:hypothetical protein BDZ88DRAFT_442172 [Geranomyces variabilis]|nr:hypothetical protein BDZ88DRAFT_442172 [Geranomyces variabilis]